eukprot:scaffold8272_cov248-Pinguiococcus_pyrenoidosus.AAC.8
MILALIPKVLKNKWSKKKQDLRSAERYDDAQAFWISPQEEVLPSPPVQHRVAPVGLLKW